MNVDYSVTNWPCLAMPATLDTEDSWEVPLLIIQSVTQNPQFKDERVSLKDLTGHVQGAEQKKLPKYVKAVDAQFKKWGRQNEFLNKFLKFRGIGWSNCECDVFHLFRDIVVRNIYIFAGVDNSINLNKIGWLANLQESSKFILK